MRISVVSPALDALYNSAGVFLPPSGGMAIAAPLCVDGHDVEIIDMTYEKEQPDFSESDVVLLTVMTSQCNEALRLAELAKSEGKVVVAGGVHPTFMSKDMLDTGLIDFVVHGEGEATITELVGAMREHSTTFMPNGMPGVSYMHNGVYQRNPDRPPPANLDELPFPARHLLHKYMDIYRRTKVGDKPATTLVTSRGCPYKCTFCSVTKFSGAKQRTRSVGSVIGEIEHVVETYGFEAFIFTDDLFTSHKRFVMDLCDEMIERGLIFPWWCMARAGGRRCGWPPTPRSPSRSRASPSRFFIGSSRAGVGVGSHWPRRCRSSRPC